MIKKCMLFALLLLNETVCPRSEVPEIKSHPLDEQVKLSLLFSLSGTTGPE